MLYLLGKTIINKVLHTLINKQIDLGTYSHVQKAK